MYAISIVKLPDDFTVFTRKQLLEKLPEVIHKRAYRYIDPESALSYIAGRLLLKRALLGGGYLVSLLEEIRYSESGKPSLKDHNFSISHSNGYVVLVFGTQFSVGIDIEKKEQIDIKLFKYLFTTDEFNSITAAENSLEQFYWYWVRKEALLKAAGCTLKDLSQLEVFETYGLYRDKRFYFTSFTFDTAFKGIVATEEKSSFQVTFLEITDLLME